MKIIALYAQDDHSLLTNRCYWKPQTFLHKESKHLSGVQDARLIPNGKRHFFDVLPDNDLSPKFTWRFNVTESQLLSVSDGIEFSLGYPANQWERQGVSFIRRLIHSDDWPYVQQLAQIAITLAKTISVHQQRLLRFGCVCRLKTLEGDYLPFWNDYKVLIQHNHQVFLEGICTSFNGLETEPSTNKENIQVTPVALSSVQQSEGFSPCHMLLTKREQEIVKLIAAGNSSKQIASRLDLSLHTIQTHRRNMMIKTGATSTGGLVHFALQNKYI